MRFWLSLVGALLLGGATVVEARGLLNFVSPAAGSGRAPQVVSPAEALSYYSAAQRVGTFAACPHLFPGAQPIALAQVSSALKPLALCSDQFAVLYSQVSKTPLVVVERLTAAQLAAAKQESRTDQFFPDPRIPVAGRAELADYVGSSYDRGHAAPAADAASARAMSQSFALSNMMPQHPENNRTTWAAVEKATRKYVKRATGSVAVFTGGLFDAKHDTIGNNKVWVPARLFKLVYDETTHRAWAYVLPNGPVAISKPISYAAFVAETGLDLLAGLPVL